MGFDHDVLVWFSKSYGLFYLLALSLAVVVYAFWPANQKKFTDAAEAILHDEEHGPRPANGRPHGDNGEKSWR